MSEMENNKLIAEFMGYDVKHNKCYSPKYNDGTISPMQFHKSWDWLMPVVQTIEAECEGVPQELIDLSLYSNFGEVYWAVLEFINQLNN